MFGLRFIAAILNLLGDFYHHRLIEILPIVVFEAILHWNFRLSNSKSKLQISEIRRPHRAFVLLYRQRFVFQVEAHSEGPQ